MAPAPLAVYVRREDDRAIVKAGKQKPKNLNQCDGFAVAPVEIRKER
jgi:hypothetical protein